MRMGGSMHQGLIGPAACLSIIKDLQRFAGVSLARHRSVLEDLRGGGCRQDWES